MVSRAHLMVEYCCPLLKISEEPLDLLLIPNLSCLYFGPSLSRAHGYHGLLSTMTGGLLVNWSQNYLGLFLSAVCMGFRGIVILSGRWLGLFFLLCLGLVGLGLMIGWS
jgi:hypothetical protein